MSPDEPVFGVFTPRLWSVVGGEPVGVLHAAAAEDDTTLCGLPVTGLMELADHVYSDMSESVRCEDCDKVVKDCSSA